MRLPELLKQAKECNDFYMDYQRFEGPGKTYLVGTMEFDNKYILARMHDRNDPCGLPFSLLKKITPRTDDGTRLSRLEKLQADAQAIGKVLVFSWSNDRFRMIPHKLVSKMQTMSSAMKRAY